MQLRSSTAKLKSASKITEDQKANKNLSKEFTRSFVPSDLMNDLKQLISKLAALCDMPVMQDELLMGASKHILVPSDECTKSAKKLFLRSFDKEKLRKMKEVLTMKKCSQKKQQLRSLLAESGLSNEQLLLLAQDNNAQHKRINWRSIPEGPRKEAKLKEHRKALRLKTQERQQRLLDMAELLKRNQVNDPGVTIVSRTGGRKCVLRKSSVSVLSHNTQQLSLENIDELSEALSGKTKNAFMHSSCHNKCKSQQKGDYSRKTCVKKKMKQIVSNILDQVSEAGYCVLVTSTIGSESGSHRAELSVVPIKMDGFIAETREMDDRHEPSEEEYAKEYAKQLERQQVHEKQQASLEKMKEIEIKLLRILTGTEEIFIPTRKRYRKGEPRPSDAERMKEYRKKLKQDPEKYQMYKQKRAINKRKRRLGELAAKVKVSNSDPPVTAPSTAAVNEQPNEAQPVDALISMAQPVGTLISMSEPVGDMTMHCAQVYEHPVCYPHQTTSVVSVHHAAQYIGQVSGIHGTHQHQQTVTFGNEMDIVELIAATHSVQNQHFG